MKCCSPQELYLFISYPALLQELQVISFFPPQLSRGLPWARVDFLSVPSLLQHIIYVHTLSWTTAYWIIQSLNHWLDLHNAKSETQQSPFSLVSMCKGSSLKVPQGICLCRLAETWLPLLKRSLEWDLSLPAIALTEEDHQNILSAHALL